MSLYGVNDKWVRNKWFKYDFFIYGINDLYCWVSIKLMIILEVELKILNQVSIFLTDPTITF
jgi:hypothetical protein